MKLRLLMFAVCIAALFLIVNRPAYKAFFTDDDLDNMANAREAPLSSFAQTLVNPQVTGAGHFRATGYLYYWTLVRTAGLRYPPYVAGIHALHLINLLLIWMLARALGAGIPGAAAAVLLYAFHAAAFNIYWEAMFVFDLLCATFILASLLAYVRGHVVLSIVLFWLSLRAKEVTIFFPLVLLAYELLLGQKRWKRLIAFFAISLTAGLLAMLQNHATDNPYTFRFTPAALWETSRYYAGKLLLIPFAGFAILAVPFLTRSRRVWFGVITFAILLGPMLFLPGRLFAAYLYVPLIGLAIAISEVSQPLWIAIFFLLWIPWNYRQFREDRRDALNVAAERRLWFTPFEDFMRAHPDTATVVWDGAPPSMLEHAIIGSARMLRDGRPVRVTWIHRVTDEWSAPDLVVLVWDEVRRRLHVIPKAPDASYFRTDEDAPAWQLLSGWEANQGHLRWTHPKSSVRLHRPANARALEILVDVYGFDAAHPGRLDVAVDGKPVGSAMLTVRKPTTFRFELPPAPEGTAIVDLSVSPPLPDPNGVDTLGQPISAIGFVEK